MKAWTLAFISPESRTSPMPHVQTVDRPSRASKNEISLVNTFYVISNGNDMYYAYSNMFLCTMYDVYTHTTSRIHSEYPFSTDKIYTSSPLCVVCVYKPIQVPITATGACNSLTPPTPAGSGMSTPTWSGRWRTRLSSSINLLWSGHTLCEIRYVLEWKVEDAAVIVNQLAMERAYVM